ISNLVRVYVNPPTHELDELTFTVDKTKVHRGEKFRVTITSSNEGLNPSYGATLQRIEEGGQYGSSNPWYGPVSEGSNIILVDTRNIEPGDYLLHVTVNAIGCHGQNKDVTVHVTAAVNTLILPSGLTVIEEEAFAGVAAQKIIVPEGVTTIDSRAFAGCPNLVEIELPEGISSFADDAFAQCTHQVKVYGPADSYLADYATRVNNLVLEPTD
nr:leucine-rich repeat domain-containing protein [Clostridiales bacterium]